MEIKCLPLSQAFIDVIVSREPGCWHLWIPIDHGIQLNHIDELLKDYWSKETLKDYWSIEGGLFQGYEIQVLLHH